MDLVLMKLNSSSAASNIVDEVAAGSLWGVDLGTTSKAASNDSYALVEATANRVSNLVAACPDSVDLLLQYHNAPAFTDLTEDNKCWFLRGRL
jgi:hypothetical protein